jgi:prepilin-type N-terminal cleavage/methylation domain-containing protein
MMGHNSSRSGFTLVELSIVIIIVSLLMASGLAVGTSMVQQANYIDTKKKLSQIRKSLHDYYIVNGHLPCAARIDLLPSDANFGRAVDCSAGISGTERYGSPLVRIGMVPSRTLGLTDRAASDAYGNRIYYAVTEGLTDAGNFSTSTGGITVRDGSSMTGNTVSDVAAYMLISPGADRKGAYAYSNAGESNPCATGNLDSQNCDLGDEIFRDASYNSGDVAAKFFDDIVDWAPKFHFMALDTDTESLWATSGIDPLNIYSVGTDNNTSTTNVGVGNSDPQYRLHVSGDVGINSNAGLLRLEGVDHAFMEFYPDGPATRKAYIGFGSAASNNLTISNEIASGELDFRTNNSPRMAISSSGLVSIGGSPQSHATLGAAAGLTVANGPVRTGDMWLGISGATNTAPDITCGVDCMMVAEANLRLGIDGDGNGGNNIYFYKGGMNTVTATEFAQLTPNSHLYLGQDNTSGAIFGSADMSASLSLYAHSGGYDDGAAIFLYGRQHSAGGQARYYITLPASSTEGHRFLRRRGGTTETLFLVRSNGNAWLQGSLNQNSDARLKTDITPIDKPLEKILTIKGINYHWNGKAAKDTETLQTGILAQDVQKAFPHLVSEGENGYLAVDKTALIAPLIEAMRELDNRNTSLEARIAILEDEIAVLRSTKPSDADSTASSLDRSFWIALLALLIAGFCLFRPRK